MGKRRSSHSEAALATYNIPHAKTANQALYIDALLKKIVVVAEGHAGCGKTYLASKVAALKYLKGEIDTIVVMRPYVGMGKSSGFWPGTIEDKLSPYLAPVLGVLAETLGTKFQADFGKNILIQPLEAVRGRSFDRAFIIVDESQNLTPEEVRSITTRLGEETQIVFCGDTRQTDIPGLNGLQYLVSTLQNNKIEDSAVVNFTADDVVRSGICAQFVKIYEAQGPLRK